MKGVRFHPPASSLAARSRPAVKKTASRLWLTTKNTKVVLVPFGDFRGEKNVASRDKTVGYAAAFW